MAVIAVLEITFKPESLDKAKEVMARVLTETRAFDGCLGVQTVVDVQDPNTLRFVETWESPEHDAAYRKFRAGEGAITDLGPLLAGAPSLSLGTVDPAI